MSIAVAAQAAEDLKYSHPSDEVRLDKKALEEIMALYDKIVGARDNGIYDIILSGTVPIRDVRIVLENEPSAYRFCVFENALDNLDSAPEGRALLVAALQEEKTGRFSLLGIIKGEEAATVSDKIHDISGKEIADTDTKKVSEFWHIWCAVQFALLHPKVKTIIANGDKQKEYTKEKDKSTGKRKRVVKYVRRHVIYGEDFERSMREINRQCLCWYVIGHWRHLSNGKTVYVKGYWKGELRELERNLDEGRLREIAANDKQKS